LTFGTVGKSNNRHVLSFSVVTPTKGHLIKNKQVEDLHESRHLGQVGEYKKLSR
jgi:hypothetical protein